jgi:outer membrane protein OmpA-like peptidoglycan-associated protein
VFDYAKIKPLVDRILVMAYDEHWSGSRPGPIASMAWCRNVAEYSLRVIGPEKLIMGLPFYGRAWGNTNPSRAYRYSRIENIMGENSVGEIRRENGIPTFDYEVPVSVKVYYEDDYSLAVRMDMYKTLGTRAVGFWCLGQETPAVWNILRMEKEKIAESIQDDINKLGIEDTSVRVVEEGITIAIENIQFAADSANLLASEKAKIDKIAEILMKYPDRDILVGGHTALAGTAGGQIRLSQERAAAVADYLIGKEVRSPDRVVVRGYGAEKPLGDNRTQEGMGRNRRVEITILEN